MYQSYVIFIKTTLVNVVCKCVFSTYFPQVFRVFLYSAHFLWEHYWICNMLFKQIFNILLQFCAFLYQHKSSTCCSRLYSYFIQIEMFIPRKSMWIFIFSFENGSKCMKRENINITLSKQVISSIIHSVSSIIHTHISFWYALSF